MLKEVSIKVLISCTGASQNLLKCLAITNSSEFTHQHKTREYQKSYFGTKLRMSSGINLNSTYIHMGNYFLTCTKYPGSVQNKHSSLPCHLSCFTCCFTQIKEKPTSLVYSRGKYCHDSILSPTQVQQRTL